jgi:hypothetical protein
MALDMQLLAWDRHKNVVGINQLMGFQSYPLDNLISNSNRYKQQKPCTDSLKTPQKYVIVHMDSTIVSEICHCTHGQYNSIRNMSLYTWTVQ